MNEPLFNYAHSIELSNIESFLTYCPSDGPDIKREYLLSHQNCAVLKVCVNLDSNSLSSLSKILYLPYYINKETQKKCRFNEEQAKILTLEHDFTNYGFDENENIRYQRIVNYISLNSKIPSNNIPIIRVSFDKYLIVDGNRRMIAAVNEIKKKGNKKKSVFYFMS